MLSVDLDLTDECIKIGDQIALIEKLNRMQSKLEIFSSSLVAYRGDLQAKAAQAHEYLQGAEAAKFSVDQSLDGLSSDLVQIKSDVRSEGASAASDAVSAVRLELDGLLQDAQRGARAAEQAASTAVSDVMSEISRFIGVAEQAVIDSQESAVLSRGHAEAAKETVAGDVIDDVLASDKSTYSSVEIEKKLGAFDTKPSTAFLMSIGAL